MAETREMPLVVLRAADLPAFCPNPSMPLWSSHPRVYFDIVDEGEVQCPYCGTRYRYEGEPPTGHR
ncbi:MAG: zinc-finger domain-containing protein [Proteobacteria bacterium]|nr:zinc-finger domain-containing protein [Pseudomonadota bacterium]